ncbi:MAG: ArgR family transcriptional regulator [Tannerella sp.]|nr:ArgR family transcriptional regulator [Tannerella sp.]
MKKEQRLKIISHILRNEVIHNQDDMIKSLADQGIVVTQATLSRDMKELRIVKKLDKNNLYVYELPEVSQSDITSKSGSDILSIEFSGSFAVIKTRPGYAMAIAGEIDTANMPEIAGTIAGDDTILVIPRDGYSREHISLAMTLYASKSN